MSKKYLMALTNPLSAETEREYNRWYDTVHIPEVTTLPDVLGARRFKASASQLSPGLIGHRYLTLYDLKDSARAVAQLTDNLSKFIPSDAIDNNATVTIVFEEIFSTYGAD
jgi:hypothetical protein